MANFQVRADVKKVTSRAELKILQLDSDSSLVYTKNKCCTILRLVEALFFIYYFGFPFFIFSIDDQSCSAATVNGLSGKTKTKASAASTAASVPRKLDQPQDLTVPDIVTWLPVLLTASSTSTQGKLLKSVDNCSVAA